jgi:hypothetical protein
LPPPSVLEFAAGSNGNVAPVRDISGSSTQLTNANGIALDRSGNIYVTLEGTVLVFASGANGNVAPSRSIAGSETDLHTANALEVNANGIYVSSCSGYIERFATDAQGNVPPQAIISGRKTRIQSCVDAIGLSKGGTVYGATWEGHPSVLGFKGLTDGDLRPRIHIVGPSTQLVDPTGMFVDDL